MITTALKTAVTASATSIASGAALQLGITPDNVAALFVWQLCASFGCFIGIFWTPNLSTKQIWGLIAISNGVGLAMFSMPWGEWQWVSLFSKPIMAVGIGFLATQWPWIKDIASRRYGGKK